MDAKNSSIRGTPEITTASDDLHLSNTTRWFLPLKKEPIQDFKFLVHRSNPPGMGNLVEGLCKVQHGSHMTGVGDLVDSLKTYWCLTIFDIDKLTYSLFY